MNLKHSPLALAVSFGVQIMRQAAIMARAAKASVSGAVEGAAAALGEVASETARIKQAAEPLNPCPCVDCGGDEQTHSSDCTYMRELVGEEDEATAAPVIKQCGMCGYEGEEDPVRGCPRCGWDDMMVKSADEAIAGTSAALRDGSLEETELRIAAATSGDYDAEAMRRVKDAEFIADRYRADPSKPKRIRVRSKPLTVEDIVAGAIYVPKRGNNRTPYITVERTTLDHDTRIRTVRWRQRGEVHVCTDHEFVKSYAARRAPE